MRKRTLLMLAILLIFNEVWSQKQFVFFIQQPDSLIADAGNDLYIPKGNSGVIGGIPTAYGGVLPYSYFWSPDDYLNDSSLANPEVTPLQTTTYQLAVVDKNFCSAYDTVIVSTDSKYNNPDFSNDLPLVYYCSKTETVHITFTHSRLQNQNMDVSFLDITGKTFYHHHARIQSGSLILNTINPPDIFFISIATSGHLWSYKITTK